ncbi:rhomboid family intramembrane serine protease [Natronomonas salina]|uniref:rhomboid family intramembrane serine protease n=1 Tax=Natronomonas salina TaxID=1710540 RepID=UPI0015B46C43|nr:rhomboid family intramembrane serine protease [Natronomonas salina]QLD87831.1 rhomboid family intramembrane serine protease [Natronomonas salina]
MGRPTLTTLALFAVVFAAQVTGFSYGFEATAFALALPLDHRPWTVVLSVYAHASPAHLVANAVALLVVGPLVAYQSTSIRFHLFFVVSGALAGVAQVLATVPYGSRPVLGASGAIFALFGYLLVGNRASEWALSWIPLGPLGRLILFAVLAAAVTLATAAPGVALVAHFTGFLVGVVAGRFRLLHKSRSTPAPESRVERPNR